MRHAWKAGDIRSRPRIVIVMLHDVSEAAFPDLATRPTRQYLWAGFRGADPAESGWRLHEIERDSNAATTRPAD